MIELVTFSMGHVDVLRHTLPRMLTIGPVVVVTTADDEATRELCRMHGVKVVLSDVSGAATSLRGAIRNEGLRAASQRDWLAVVDPDILLPEFDFTAYAPYPGCFYGMRRRRAVSKADLQRPGYELPLVFDGWNDTHVGFFQMFHASDPRWRNYPEATIDGISEDCQFRERWPRQLWRELPCHCLHLDRDGGDWSGPNFSESI